MSGSDSEDDSFLDITKKLSAMKKNCHVNYSDPVIQTNSVAEPVATASPSKRNQHISPSKSKRRKSVDSDSSGSIDLDEFRSKYPPIEEPKGKGKRGTGRGRGKKRKCDQNSPNLAESQLFLPRRRKRSSANTSSLVLEDLATPVEAAPRTRGRGRARGKGRAKARGRGRNGSNMFSDINFGDILSFIQSSSVMQSSNIMQAIATYSVGNTDEYPDQCDNQALFSQKKTVDTSKVEELDESLEDNEEFSVKVHWRNTDFFLFQIRKHQKLTVMYNFFAKEENVTHDKLLFTYEDRILRVEDTPGGIDYSIAKFIEGGIVTQSVALPTETREDTDGIKLKFQCQNVKKPYETYIKPDQKMSIAMLRCAEHLGKPVDQLRFEFDGDLISGINTPQDLELEGGECIDVKVLS